MIVRNSCSLAGVIAVIMLLVSPVFADSFSSLEGFPFEIDDSLGLQYAGPDTVDQTETIYGRVRHIIYPVLGFPSIVEPGDSIGIMVQLDNPEFMAPEAWTIQLTTRYFDSQSGGYPVGDPVAQVYPMQIEEILFDEDTGVYTLVSQVMSGTPMDNYSLRITNEQIVDVQPAAVSVQRNIDGTFRFVHFSDTQPTEPRSAKGYDFNNGTYPNKNIMDPDGGIIRQAIEEINLLRPSFAVVTGDLVDGDDYGAQTIALHDIVRNSRTPIFMVPGNHDGMVTFDEDDEIVNDGLSYHRRFFGPTYYSFDYGDLHVACVNSYDGSVERRQGQETGWFGKNAKNYGGQLSQQQLEWLNADLRAATAAGKFSYVFMHHDPRGPYNKNKPSNGLGMRLRGDGWNYDSSGWDSDPTDDYFNETEEVNTGTQVVRIISENNVVAVFLGHVHEDVVDVYEAGDEIENAKGKGIGIFAERPLYFISTTSLGGKPSAAGGYWGYRVIEVENNFITRLNYTDSKLIQSVPAGNAWLEDQWGNDGTGQDIALKLVNNLPRTLVGTARFFALANNVGYDLIRFDTEEKVAFKDVGLTDTGGVCLYATLRGEAATSVAGFPPPIYEDSRTDYLLRSSTTNTAPMAVIKVGTDPGDLMAFEFRADESTDPNGDETIWRYDWYLGDGTWKTGRVIRHKYSQQGDYTVMLRLTDDHGGQNEATDTVRAFKRSKDDDEDNCGIIGGADASGLALLMLLSLTWLACRRRKV